MVQLWQLACTAMLAAFEHDAQKQKLCQVVSRAFDVLMVRDWPEQEAKGIQASFKQLESDCLDLVVSPPEPGLPGKKLTEDALRCLETLGHCAMKLTKWPSRDLPGGDGVTAARLLEASRGALPESLGRYWRSVYETPYNNWPFMKHHSPQLRPPEGGWWPLNHTGLRPAVRTFQRSFPLVEAEFQKNLPLLEQSAWLASNGPLVLREKHDVAIPFMAAPDHKRASGGWVMELCELLPHLCESFARLLPSTERPLLFAPGEWLALRRLRPGGKVLPHNDAERITVCQCLVGCEHAWTRVGNETRYFGTPGTILAFDNIVDHSVGNDGSTDRWVVCLHSIHPDFEKLFDVLVPFPTVRNQPIELPTLDALSVVNQDHCARPAAIDGSRSIATEPSEPASSQPHRLDARGVAGYWHRTSSTLDHCSLHPVPQPKLTRPNSAETWSTQELGNRLSLRTHKNIVMTTRWADNRTSIFMLQLIDVADGFSNSVFASFHNLNELISKIGCSAFGGYLKQAYDESISDSVLLLEQEIQRLPYVTELGDFRLRPAELYLESMPILPPAEQLSAFYNGLQDAALRVPWARLEQVDGDCDMLMHLLTETSNGLHRAMYSHILAMYWSFYHDPGVWGLQQEYQLQRPRGEVIMKPKLGLRRWLILYDLLEIILSRCENGQILSNSTPVLKVVEIGVNTGQLTSSLLNWLPSVHVLGVDPYYQYTGVLGDIVGGQTDFEQAVKELTPYMGRAALAMLPSRSAAAWIGNGTMDLVFIDGLHTYDAVLEDIVLWAPKVRSGGIVSGHDFHSEGDYGVARAVYETIPSGVTLHLTHDYVWFWWVP